jgi:branched-chain amino acid transport system ATP-binding protein
MGSVILEVNEIKKSFGGLTAVYDLDFEVKDGEILGLIGPNGAGKTTVFNLITGFDIPDKGEVNFLGKGILGLHPFEICRLGITRTFQQAKPMFGMTILENVVVGALNRLNKLRDAVNYSKEVLNSLGLLDYKDILAENLPIGYRRMLEIAKCLSTKPRLLLLDEVMAGLNPSEISLIIEKIKAIQSQGVTILMIEHVMEAVMSICDRIIVLDYGKKISEGVPGEISKDPNVIEAYLGDKVTF